MPARTKPRIGLLVIGHRDYQNDIGMKFAAQARRALEQREVDIVMCEKPLIEMLQASAEAKAMLAKDVDGVILFLGTWIESSTALAAVRTVEHLPFMIWGFPMFVSPAGKLDSTGSFVSYAVFKGALDRVGYVYKGVLGPVDDEKTLEKVRSFCLVAGAHARLKETRIGLFGYASMAMYPGTFDHLLLRTSIGPEVIHFDTYTLIEHMKSVRDTDVEAEAERLRERIEISQDVRSEDLLTSLRMFLALKSLAQEHVLDAVNVKCQYELSQEFGMTACLPISLMADEGFVSACEGDIITTVSMIILNYLSTQVIYYGDIVDLRDSTIWLSSCGAAPTSLADRSKPAMVRNFSDIFDFLQSTEKGESQGMNRESFKGIVNSFVLRPGGLTYGRLVEGVGSYKFVLGTGRGVETELRQGLMPGLRIETDGNVEKLIDNFPSQHFTYCYGNFTGSVKDLCHILGVEVLEI